MAARIVLLLLPALGLLLIAAHFLRAGLLPLAAACAATVTLLFVRAPWAARSVQLVLLLAAVEWLRTAWTFATQRAELGQPYGRLLLILGAVAIFSVVAAWVLQHARLRRHFRRG